MPETLGTEIVVVGGGIGGLAAALALSRIGKHVCVLEQSKEFAEIGAGIQLGPNVYKMFERLDIVDAINAISAFPDVLTMRDSITGEAFAELPAGEQFRTRFGYPYAVIHRADLHGVILAACRAAANVELRTEAKVAAIEEEDAGVTAVTADGLRVSGEALIGADGIRSMVRERVVGDGAVRPARSQRLGQDDDDPDADRAHRADLRQRQRARPQSFARAARRQEARRLPAGRRGVLRPSVGA